MFLINMSHKEEHDAFYWHVDYWCLGMFLQAVRSKPAEESNICAAGLPWNSLFVIALILQLVFFH